MDTLQCRACQETKSASEFSKTQQRKCLAWRCKRCVESGAGLPQLSRHQALFVSSRKVPKSGSSRTAILNSDRCRVRDVQERYGHMCEIPIEAYCEAGVASCWEDYVTEADVDRASAAWDARSLAHDIDTQWGEMPHGGAYSDSNTYYGSGIYDYY